MMHISFYRLILCFIFLLLSSSCSFLKQQGDDRPNIIVFSIEGVNFDKMSCEDSSESSNGFRQLCLSGLRFTHFFSPSTLSQASMASFLAAMGPSEHRVFDNGASFLSETVFTLPEKAVTAGYKTAFFSGGPPLLCKSGLQQGIEVCDDEFLSSDSLFRPVHLNLERAKAWIQEQEGPFFLNLYAPDTQFYNQITINEDGKERAKTFDSQVDEIDESLRLFIDWLKQKKFWSNTVLIVMGMNGESLALRSTTWRENVFTENVHVPLFIQLPFLQKEAARSVDSMLSHSHVGKFIFGLLDSVKTKDSFELYVDDWLSQLPKFVEIRSDWQSWWFSYPSMISFRTEDYLIFPKRQLVAYHSVADPAEITPISENQIDKKELEWVPYRVDQSFDVKVKYNDEMYTFLRAINKQRPDSAKNIIDRLSKNSKNAIIETIQTDIAVEKNDWDYLKNNVYAVVEYVAQKNLNMTKIPQLQTACEKLFYSRKRLTFLRNCSDSLLLALLAWEKHIKESDALYWEKRFIRKYRFYRQYKHLAYRNLFMDLNWHVDSSRLMGPSLTDLYLRLPDKENLRKKISTYPLPSGLNFLYE